MPPTSSGSPMARPPNSTRSNGRCARGYFLMRRGFELEQFRHPGVRSAAPTCLSWKRAIRCSRSRASCGPSRWLNSAFSGSYRETLNNPALNLDIAQTRTRPHQIRLRRQPRAGADRRYRPVRPLELERRQDRDHGVHRHRRLAVARRLDQGREMGPARRRDRHRRRDQRAVAATIATSSPPAGSAR